MVRCANCGAEAQPNWKFCLSCGAELPAPGAVPQGPPVLYPPGMGGPPPQFQTPAPGTAQGGPHRAPTVWIAIAFAVMAAAGAFFFLQSSRSPSSSTTTTSPPATTEPVVPVMEPSANPEPAEPTAAFPGMTPPAADASPAVNHDMDPGPSHRPPPHREPSDAVSTMPGGLQVAVADESQPNVHVAGPDPGLPATPDRNVVRSKFESVRAPIRACVAGGAGTAVAATVIEGATGRVTSVEVSGDFTGPDATCIANAIRSLNFGPFANATLTVNYNYRF